MLRSARLDTPGTLPQVIEEMASSKDNGRSWSAVVWFAPWVGGAVAKSLRRGGNQEKGDARILGSREFVKQVIDEADQHIQYQLAGADPLQSATHAIQAFCNAYNLPIAVLRGGSCWRAVS